MSLSCSSALVSFSDSFFDGGSGKGIKSLLFMIFCIYFCKAIWVCIIMIWLIYSIGLLPLIYVKTSCLIRFIICVCSTIIFYIYLAFIAISLLFGWFRRSAPVVYKAFVQLVIYFLGFYSGSIIDPVITIVSS